MSGTPGGNQVLTHPDFYCYDVSMKNNDNQALLAHKRRIDTQRKAAAIAKRDAANKAAIRKVGGAK